MYVVTHKEFEKPHIQGYYSLLVGANNNIFTGSDFYDNLGDNISDKNRNYCELTGLYWIWKNTVSDIVGLCHYRRYFSKSTFSKHEKHYVTIKDIKSYMCKYDVIMPRKRYYKETTYEALNIAPNIDDIDAIKVAIKTVCPEYLVLFNEYLQSNKCYLYNMFIMRKKLMDDYCSWLFPILEYIEKNYKVDNKDPYRSRLFGFLSERLIYVWIKGNINEKKILELRVVKTDESNLWLVGQEIKNKIRDYVFHLHQIGR